jgi:predicted nucleic acid-binding protein
MTPATTPGLPPLATGRGRTVQLVLKIEEYHRMTIQPRSLVEALAMPGLADTEFDAPRLRDPARPASLHVPNPQPGRDAFIAAPALAHGITAITRNTSDFAPSGVPVLNPWEA